MTETAIAAKGRDGRFVKGASGNPTGRPLTKRQSINDQQMTIEAAIRKKIPPEKIITAVTKQVELAASGDTKAFAAIIPYFLTKPTAEDRDTASGTQLVIKVENATLFAEKERKTTNVKESLIPPIDAEFTQVTANG